MKKLKDYTEEELELMNYDDIAYLVLTESKKKMKINDLFKKVCEVLNLSEEEYLDKIADFFEILTTDKRFTLLKNGYWDLKTNVVEKVVIEDEDEELEEPIEEEEENTIEEEKNIYDDEVDEDLDDDDDIKDLVIIDDEDEENDLI